MDPVYHVKLEVFEGPLDLLYHLVEEEEIDIWDIPIARITEQYLAYLDAMRELNIEVAGEFLVMAARLLYIKAKMLLPETPNADGAEDEDDPRMDLAAALLEYKLFKEAAGRLGELGEGRWAFVGRPPEVAPQGIRPVFDDPAGGRGAVDLAKAFARVLSSLRPPKPIPLPRAFVSVAEKVSQLRQLFTRRRRVAFDSLFSRDAGRPEVIATFLALLELIRRGVLAARQDGLFGPITIERAESEIRPAEEA